MSTAVLNPTIQDVLSESFTLQESLDGYWYPSEPGTPLVRVYVTARDYCIERRRNPGAPFLPVVSAHIEEFDATAFRAWRTRYPMSV